MRIWGGSSEGSRTDPLDMGVICGKVTSGTMVRAEVGDGDVGVRACHEWERRKTSRWESQSANICQVVIFITWMVLFDPAAILQQHTITPATHGQTGFSPTRTMQMEEKLARDTIQIKYALRRTVWFCTSVSMDSYFTTNVWNQCIFFPGASENTGPYGKQAKYAGMKLQDIKLSCWLGK